MTWLGLLLFFLWSPVEVLSRGARASPKLAACQFSRTQSLESSKHSHVLHEGRTRSVMRGQSREPPRLPNQILLPVRKGSGLGGGLGCRTAEVEVLPVHLELCLFIFHP